MPDSLTAIDVIIPPPVPQYLEVVLSVGPQGPQGPQGPPGPSLSTSLIVQASDFGSIGVAVPAATNTATIQAAIDYVAANGPGIVILPPGELVLAASSLDEDYDNAGVVIPASECAIVLRSGVTLQGVGKTITRLKPNDPVLSCIFHISPDGGGVRDLQIDNGWNPPDYGGHGIITFNKAGPADQWVRDVEYRNLIIKNVGSYGIGVENGDIEGVVISDVHFYRMGVDGIDLKTRGPGHLGRGIFIENIYIEGVGLRSSVAGSVGIDLRGRCTVNNVHIVNLGTPDGVGGIRWRSADGPGLSASEYSTLSNFVIECNGSPATGITIGAAHAHVSNGTIIGATEGVLTTGNANSQGNYATIMGVTAVNSLTYGFHAGTTGVTFNACVANGGPTGFRDDGVDTSFMGCSAPGATTLVSVAGASGPSFKQVGRLNVNWLSESGAPTSTDRAAIQMTGAAANIDFVIFPKGTGLIRYGTHAARVAENVTGYIQIRDAGGVVRKLAVIS